jgi:hypothetical protein
LGRHVERDDLVFAAEVDDARLDVWCVLLRPGELLVRGGEAVEDVDAEEGPDLLGRHAIAQER